MNQDIYTQFNKYLQEKNGKKLVRTVDYDLKKFSDNLDRAIRSQNEDEIDAVLGVQDELRRRIKNSVGLEAAIFFDETIKELMK